MNAEQDKDIRALDGESISGDRYRLLKYMGEGNFGVVYLSEQRFFGQPVRRVAIKISKVKGLDDAKAANMFADALLLARALDEMNDTDARQYIMQVFDAGLAAGLENRGYMVMDYVSRTTLEKEFESFGRVPANQLLKWVKQMCRGLKGLHALAPPLVHRDLKPDNVLLGEDLNVRVVDFGLAARALELGYVPGVAGTYTYMAPETMEGKGKSVPASDVYSLGLILYQGLTGELPFPQPPYNLPKALEAIWILDQRARIVPPPPSRRNPSVSRELERIILRCLAFSSVERYRHAGELLTALEQLDAPSPPSRSTERFQQLCELGERLFQGGEFQEAAARWIDAWELNKQEMVLRMREQRAAHLRKIIDAYCKGGNDFQADRYRRLLRQEENPHE